VAANDLGRLRIRLYYWKRGLLHVNKYLIKQLNKKKVSSIFNSNWNIHKNLNDIDSKGFSSGCCQSYNLHPRIYVHALLATFRKQS